MTINKIEINLKGVPQTLLLPLYGRAEYSNKPYSPIQDQYAKKLTQAINNPSAMTIATKFAVYWIARAYHFDQAIKNFLCKHPQAVIVNLGAGLETAFYRLDNGKLTWIDLDLPEVIALRKKLLHSSNRIIQIDKSVLDFSWMQDVKKYGKDFFFFAGGLFMYFTEEQIKALFLNMAEHFKNSELIFDSLSRKDLKYANRMLDKAAMSNCTLQWGLDHADELQSWSKDIKVIAQKCCFADIKNKFKFPLIMRVKMFLYDWVSKNRIVHLKFN